MIDEAVQVLDETQRRWEVSAESLYMLGEAAEKSGDDAKASSLWQRAMAYKSFEDGHRRLADLYERGEQKALARKHRGLEHFERGKAAWFENDLEAAQVDLLRAIELHASYDLAWFYLADTRHALGDAEGARQAYQQCLQINPNHGRALRGLNRLEQNPAAAP